MATAADLLTLEQFHAEYGNGPYEYWFGKVIKKEVGTWRHGTLQGILMDFLRRAGYKSAVEVSLRVDPNWEPLPDVIGHRSTPGDYPTEPVDVVVEILSPGDTFPTVMAKCRHYTGIGQKLVFVLDPEARIGYEWKGRALETIQKLLLPNSQIIDLNEVWTELDNRLA